MNNDLIRRADALDAIRNCEIPMHCDIEAGDVLALVDRAIEAVPVADAVPVRHGRLIDADAFIVDSIKNKRFVIQSEDFKNDSIIVETVYGDLLDAIKNAPTIDAVEVVRCRYCENWVPLRNFIEIGNCTRCVSTCTPGGFFCADGKRKKAGE